MASGNGGSLPLLLRRGLMAVILVVLFFQLRVSLRISLATASRSSAPELILETNATDSRNPVMVNEPVANYVAELVRDYKNMTSQPTSGAQFLPQPPEGHHLVQEFRSGHRTSLPSGSIPVILWPLMDAAASKRQKGSSADMVHIEENGVKESTVLRLANTSIVHATEEEPHIVWVTDAKFPYSQWCTRLSQKAVTAQAKRRARGWADKWPVFVVDFTDTTHYEDCPALEQTLGKGTIFYFKRSTVVNRTWNFESDWLELGQPLPKITSEGRVYQQTPLIVRTDTVEAISSVLASHPTNRVTLADAMEDPRVWDRPVDVAHYWPPSTDRAVFSNLRNRVSTLLVEHFAARYQVFCDTVGTADRAGRRQAQSVYVRAMLETKIIVVAQRDTYEDHYRLYEALASGAMVLTDPMWTLPVGFQNGMNLIVYSSLSDMVQHVAYFLQHEEERLVIAKAGRLVAMSQHRSWHRMEELILGRAVTTCDNSQKSNPNCPYSIHTGKVAEEPS